MNAVGRQMQRSGHQRQYSDSNFLDSSTSNGKWLHQSSNSTNNPLASQDFGYYGVGTGGGSRMYRNMQRSINGGNELFSEPLTPPNRRNGEEMLIPTELSPGILDLHSIDTELLSEVPAMYESSSLYSSGRGRSYDDSDTYLSESKQTGRTRGLPDNNLMKSFSGEKDKSSLAKIKVVVRKRPLINL